MNYKTLISLIGTYSILLGSTFAEVSESKNKDSNQNNLEEKISIFDQKIILPLKDTYVTSEYGNREHPLTGKNKFHYGVDFGTNKKPSPIYSPFEAKVEEAEWKNGYGKTIVLENEIYGLSFLFGHCSKLTIKPGSIVEKGQLIGYTGKTGNSTGIHLHLEAIALDKNKLLIYFPNIKFGNNNSKGETTLDPLQIFNPSNFKPNYLEIGDNSEEYSEIKNYFLENRDLIVENFLSQINFPKEKYEPKRIFKENS
jgi:murein DD-endopeptidase MepM/ murein hydrolase activator NlpD